jgi:regulator of replication initiation timing
MSLRKAKNQIKSMRKSIENDKNYPSIFVEKNFSFEIFDENLANRLSFLKTIKKEVKKIEKR